MIVLYILAVFILILLLLLCLPMYFRVSFNENLIIEVRVLFFYFKLFPREKKEKAKNQSEVDNIEQTNEKLSNESKKNKILNVIKAKGPIGFLRILKELTKIALNSAKKIFNCIFVDSMKLDFLVVGKDAADTAVNYGKVYSFASFAFPILLKNVNKKKSYLNIHPGFNEKESKVDFVAIIHFVPIRIFIVLIAMLIKFVKVLYENKINLKVRKDTVK